MTLRVYPVAWWRKKNQFPKFWGIKKKWGGGAGLRTITTTSAEKTVTHDRRKLPDLHASTATQARRTRVPSLLTNANKPLCKGKTLLSLCTPRTYAGVEVSLRSFLDSALDEGGWAAFHSRSITAGKIPRYPTNGRLRGPHSRSGCSGEKSLDPAGNQTKTLCISNSHPSRYNHWAIPATNVLDLSHISSKKI
jgi:hypothetical protein